MERPLCPKCGVKPIIAFFQPTFTCPQCGSSLHSNLCWVAFLEWVIGGVIFFVIGWLLHQHPQLASWSYVQMVLLMFIPACIVHAVVIAKFVRLYGE